MSLSKKNNIVRVESTTATTGSQYYVLENNKLFRQCPLCGQGLHTKIQAKACMAQDKSLVFNSNGLKYQFSFWERLLRFWL